jgi:hypothetical protein
MTLIVHTARISSRDPDRFDVTRKSGGEAGAPFAPSWAILRPALDARNMANRRREMAEEMRKRTMDPESLANANRLDLAAADDERRAWTAYVPAFTAEMRESYRRHPETWRRLLTRDRVVLVCYCTDPERCHRTLLAGILGKLGADVRGELPR